MTDDQARIAALIKRLLGQGAEIERSARLTAGAGAQTQRLQIRSGNEQHDWILRRGFDSAGFGGMIDKTTEGQLVQRLHQAGIAAPPVLHILEPQDELGEGFVMPRLTGESLAPRIIKRDDLETARRRLPVQCGAELARLHSLPIDGFSELPLRDASASLADYRELYTGFGQLLPAFEITIQRLQSTLPSTGDSTVVHGDFRNGNLLVDEHGLTAVLDWELAHLGDPAEDLAWLCTLPWRFGRLRQPVGGFGSRAALLDAYHDHGGRNLDPERLRWWELFGVLKWGVICLYQLQLHLDGSDPSLERLAIGRRISECELDMLALLADIDLEAA